MTPSCTTHGVNRLGDRFAPAPDKLPLSSSRALREGSASVQLGALEMYSLSHSMRSWERRGYCCQRPLSPRDIG